MTINKNSMFNIIIIKFISLFVALDTIKTHLDEKIQKSTKSVSLATVDVVSK